MRLAIEHTDADWRAYLRFISQRATFHRRAFWVTVIVTAVLFAVLLSLLSRGDGWRFDTASALLAIAFVVGTMAVIARWNRSASGIPESWLGPQLYELLEDGVHVSSGTGRSFVRWRAVREVVETADQLFLLLDRVAALIVPTRALAAAGGTAAVLDEIGRLRNAAAARDAASAAPIAAGDSAEPVLASAPGGAQAAGEPGSAPSMGEPGGARPALPASAPASSRARAAASPWLALPLNLLAGARLTFFVPVRASDFTASARQVVLLVGVAIGVWLLIDRMRIGTDALISWYPVVMVTGLGALALALLLALSPGLKSNDRPAGLATAVASASPFLVLLGTLPSVTSLPAASLKVLMALVPALAAIVLYRAHRVMLAESPPGSALRAIATVAALWWTFGATLYAQPEFWYSTAAADADAGEDWTEGESLLFGQPDLIDAALERVRNGQPGVTDTFFVGFAGYGEQDVFDKEVNFARAALGRRIDLQGRAVQLVNSPQRDDATPLATVSGLRRTLAGVAQRMNLEEDVLVLFLTSHGDENAELSVSQDMLPLQTLSGEVLRAALDEAGIRWRIVVISACHSGSFIPHLRTPHTLIATAARADRSSFGCSDERELTYFGEALWRDAMPASSGFMDAFARTRQIVSKHEAEEDIKNAERSEPQVYVGERMRAKLAELKFRAPT